MKNLQVLLTQAERLSIPATTTAELRDLIIGRLIAGKSFKPKPKTPHRKRYQIRLPEVVSELIEQKAKETSRSESDILRELLGAKQ